MPLGVRIGNLQVSGYGFFFSSVVLVGEMKSLYIKVRFLFFKYDSISVYAKSSLT